MEEHCVHTKLKGIMLCSHLYPLLLFGQGFKMKDQLGSANGWVLVTLIN